MKGWSDLPDELKLEILSHAADISSLTSSSRTKEQSLLHLGWEEDGSEIGAGLGNLGRQALVRIHSDFRRKHALPPSAINGIAAQIAPFKHKDLIRLASVSTEFSRLIWDATLWRVLHLTPVLAWLGLEHTRSTFLSKIGPALRHLSLAHATHLSNPDLESILSHTPNLVSLDLTGSFVSSASNYSPSPPSPPDSASSSGLDLAGLLDLVPRLEVLVLDGCALDSGELSCLQHERRVPRLSWLSLRDVRGISLSGSALCALADIPQKLHTLALDGCWKLDATDLIRIVRHHKASLKSLSLARCSAAVNDGFLHSLGEVLGPSLSEIFLDGNVNASSPGVAHFIGMLNPDVRSLSLTHCDYVKDDVLEAIAERLPHLTHLSLEGCHKVRPDAISTVLRANSGAPGFISLNFARCRKFTSEVIEVLGDTAGLESLLSLNLAECGYIYSSALLALAPRTPRLRSLNIKRVSLKGFTASLIQLVQHWPLLEDLDLSGAASLHNEGIVALAEACPRLRLLDLSSTHTDDAVLSVLGARLPALVSLTLRRCKRVTDAGFEALAGSASPSLAYVDAFRCTGVSEQGIDALAFRNVYVNEFAVPQAAEETSEIGNDAFWGAREQMAGHNDAHFLRSIARLERT